jgi:hypothetical protein
MAEHPDRERVRRIGLNQAVYRTVNDRVQWIAATLKAAPAQLLLVCECGDITCDEQIELSRADYEAVRSDSSLFAVVPGQRPITSRASSAEDRGSRSCARSRGSRPRLQPTAIPVPAEKWRGRCLTLPAELAEAVDDLREATELSVHRVLVGSDNQAAAGSAVASRIRSAIDCGCATATKACEVPGIVSVSCAPAGRPLTAEAPGDGAFFLDDHKRRRQLSPQRPVARRGGECWCRRPRQRVPQARARARTGASAHATAIASTSTIISGRARAVTPTAVEAGCSLPKNSPLICVYSRRRVMSVR